MRNPHAGHSDTLRYSTRRISTSPPSPAFPVYANPASDRSLPHSHSYTRGCYCCRSRGKRCMDVPVGAGIRPSTGSHAVHRHASYPNSGCEEDDHTPRNASLSQVPARTHRNEDQTRCLAPYPSGYRVFHSSEEGIEEGKCMQLGSETGQKHCARCRKQLCVPAHYQDGLWFHFSCWQSGAHQLADASQDFIRGTPHARTLPAVLVFFRVRSPVSPPSPNCQRRFFAAGFFLTYAKAVVTPDAPSPTTSAAHPGAPGGLVHVMDECNQIQIERSI